MKSTATAIWSRNCLLGWRKSLMNLSRRWPGVVNSGAGWEGGRTLSSCIDTPREHSGEFRAVPKDHHPTRNKNFVSSYPQERSDPSRDSKLF